jgi:AraC-like DNA-binding protein
VRTKNFVESYFDAWNHSDSKAVAGHLASDGIYCDVPENTERTQAQLIASLDSFFSSFRHRYRLLGELVSGKNTIAFQYEALGPDEVRYRGAEFMTLRGDAALTITDYYDYPGQPNPGQKYAKSGLNQEQKLRYSRQLESIMQSQQMFLRSDLTLPKLAERVGCSGNHLSQIINSEFGASFFEYLNQYRVEYAKELLSRQDDRSRSILDIAFTVGFNSNSAFYTAFKKRVGVTPAQYRRRQLLKRD